MTIRPRTFAALAPLAALCAPAVLAAESASGTATQHYNAGRLDTNGYLFYGDKYGYMDPFTLWRGADGQWSDVNPDGGAGGGDGGIPTGQWQTRASVAGMEVHVYTPSGATANGQRALMISLHGCAQANEIVRDSWGWRDEADEYGMVVAAPMAPNGGVIAGCWDYYDSNHRRSRPGRHDDNLVGLAEALLADASLGIDPDQVYVSGLSSGGGETFVMGCLAPEIFAGIGIAAGPAVGTSSSEIGSVATSASQAASTCRSFADAGNRDGFATQVASVVHGDADYTVAQGYAEVNAVALADVYGASRGGSQSVPGGGTETVFADADGPRVQKVIVSGLGHAWPAGPDEAGGAYTDHATIDYPAVLTAFLFEHNRRADLGGGADVPPAAPTGVTVSGATETGLTVSWTGGGEADLQDFDVLIDGSAVLTTTAEQAQVTGLAPGTAYAVSVTARDLAGNVSAPSASVQASTLPSGGGGADTTPPASPQGLSVTARTQGSITLDWADNAEADLAAYVVTLDGAQVAEVTASTYRFEGLAPGTGYTLGVAARDQAGNASAPSTLAASTEAGFSCRATTSSNYAHTTAGRAARCGAYASYACTVGSGENLGLWNTYTTTTVREVSAGYFEKGACAP